jgi:hypothetical protein
MAVAIHNIVKQAGNVMVMMLRVTFHMQRQNAVEKGRAVGAKGHLADYVPAIPQN